MLQTEMNWIDEILIFGDGTPMNNNSTGIYSVTGQNLLCEVVHQKHCSNLATPRLPSAGDPAKDQL